MKSNPCVSGTLKISFIFILSKHEIGWAPAKEEGKEEAINGSGQRCRFKHRGKSIAFVKFHTTESF